MHVCRLGDIWTGRPHPAYSSRRPHGARVSRKHNTNIQVSLLLLGGLLRYITMPLRIALQKQNGLTDITTLPGLQTHNDDLNGWRQFISEQLKM